MKQSTKLRWCLAIGLSLGAGTVARAQAPPPPGSLPAGVDGLLGQWGGTLDRLVDDLNTEVANNPAGRYLIGDTRELMQAIVDLRANLANPGDAYQARRLYSGVDGSWHHLQAQFSQPGIATPIINRDIDRVSQIDNQLHQALSLNTLPPNYYSSAAAPVGISETQRLARALADRADALAATVRADLTGGGGARPLQDAINLAQIADNFNDGLNPNAGVDAARDGFNQVVAQGNVLQGDLNGFPDSARCQAAWQAYKSTEVLLRQNLGIDIPPADLSGTAIPQQGPSPVVALADQLVGQVQAFLQVFSQTAAAVPEAGFFLADAQRLRDAAVNFRQDVAQNLNPAQLAFEFRDVDACWQRLARRTNRIAQGRSGPNIQQVGVMGGTCSQIHQLLGMPGYPPTVGPFMPQG